MLALRLLALFVGALAGLFGAAFADAQESPSTAPILRIETGMHAAAINKLALSEANGQLVTVSDDKTARLWSLADGRLLDTLRVPIAPGAEGSLYAVALPPSGRSIA
ncbi:MAG: hypothetical protein HY246_06915, partial [Proteobacteria bacterium]|nr:hypothetical protein [Pseudomonadota bacterium]